MAAKKKTTSRVSSAFKPKDRPAPAEAKKAAAEATGDNSKKIGRPKATHGLKRTSVMIDPDKMAKIKKLAIDESCHVYELIDEAFTLLISDRRNR